MIAMEMTVTPQKERNGGGNSSSTEQASSSSPSFENGTGAGGGGGIGSSSSPSLRMRGVSSEEDEEEGHQTTIRRRNSLPGALSGLSALIQAATSQLGHLIDDSAAAGGEGEGVGSTYDSGVYTGSSNRHRTTAPRRQSWHPPPSPPSFGPTTQVSRSPSRERTQLRLKDLRGNNNKQVTIGGLSTPGAPSSSNDLVGSSTAGKHDSMRPSESSQPPVTPINALEPDPNKHSFPELLMSLSLNPDNVDVITFLPDGKFFAMRSKQFADTIMTKYFAVSTLEDFLELANDWGFSRIVSNPDAVSPRDIEVFRHPCFVKGDWHRCSHIKFGETPTNARVSALPEMSRIVSTSSDDNGSGGDHMKTPSSASLPILTPPSAAHDSSTANSGSNSKRRLSPGFLHRRESESSVSSQKLRMRSPGGGHDAAAVEHDTTATTPGHRKDSVDSDNELVTVDRLPSPTTAKVDELRSIALSITTEKLKLKCDDAAMDDVTTAATSNEMEPTTNHPHHVGKGGKLVDRAVESATHTIVTDAIETLLRDEGHTKITYLKHERELSVSSIPGVVPISKQLFSPDSSSSVPATATAVAATAPPQASSIPADKATSKSCGDAGMVPLSVPEPAEITPPLQPKNSKNGVPDTPLDAPSRTAPSTLDTTTWVPNSTPPS